MRTYELVGNFTLSSSPAVRDPSCLLSNPIRSIFYSTISPFLCHLPASFGASREKIIVRNCLNELNYYCRAYYCAVGLHGGGERPRGLCVDLQAPVGDRDVRPSVRGRVRKVQHRGADGAAGRQRHARRGQELHHLLHGEKNVMYVASFILFFPTLHASIYSSTDLTMSPQGKQLVETREQRFPCEHLASLSQHTLCATQTVGSGTETTIFVNTRGGGVFPTRPYASLPFRHRHTRARIRHTRTAHNAKTSRALEWACDDCCDWPLLVVLYLLLFGLCVLFYYTPLSLCLLVASHLGTAVLRH